MRQAFVGAIAVIGMVACGGEVARRSDPSEESTTVPEGRPGDPKPSTASPGDIPLPDCDPGFPIGERSAFKACSFVVEALCYETKEAACACACPSRTGTTCLSGFPQYDGEVDVSCD